MCKKFKFATAKKKGVAPSPGRNKTKVTEVHSERCGPNGQFIVAYMQLAGTTKPRSGFMEPVFELIKDKESQLFDEFDIRIEKLYRRVSRDNDNTMLNGNPDKNGREYNWSVVVGFCEDAENELQKDQMMKKMCETMVRVMTAEDKKNGFLRTYKTNEAGLVHSKSPPRSLDEVLPNENVAMIVENYFPLEKCQDLYELLGGEEEGVADLVFSRDRYDMFAKCAVDKWGYPKGVREKQDASQDQEECRSEVDESKIGDEPNDE